MSTRNRQAPGPASRTRRACVAGSRVSLITPLARVRPPDRRGGGFSEPGRFRDGRRTRSQPLCSDGTKAVTTASLRCGGAGRRGAVPEPSYRTARKGASIVSLRRFLPSPPRHGCASAHRLALLEIDLPCQIDSSRAVRSRLHYEQARAALAAFGDGHGKSARAGSTMRVGQFVLRHRPHHSFSFGVRSRS